MTMQQDPFAAVRLNQNSQQQLQSKTQPIQKNDPFSDVRVKKVEGFPYLHETGRHAARLGSRLAETIIGIPGDIQSLINSGVFAGLEKITGLPPASEEAREEARSRSLPTSGRLKEFSQKTTGGFTSPQSKIEESIDESVETVASLLGPNKFRKALGIGLGAVAAKKGLEQVGFGKGTQEAGKLGTLFMLSLINPNGAIKFASSQYDKANSLAKGVSIPASNLESSLKNLESNLRKGVTTPAKNIVIKPTEELIGKIKNGKIPVQELTNAKRDINTLMGDPSLLKRERNLLKDLARHVDVAIKPFEKINPEFSKAYRPANEIYGAVMQGNKASNFIKKTLGPKSIFATIAGETILGQPEAILPTAGAALGIHGGAKLYDFATRVAKSKQLQKFYSKALVAAAKEDAPALRLYEKQIEDYLKK
jgi:hypothetical protein